MRVFLAAALVACGPKPAPAPASQTAQVTPIADQMDTFEMHGYVLAGAEYWPYIGKDDIKYPDEVLWGFYPAKGEIAPGETEPNADSAAPQAIACAKQSFAALQVFLAKDPPLLRQIVSRGEAQGYVPRFYLWTNDYSGAATPYPPGVREARLWYWKRKQPAPPKPPGYWKWEATLTQERECKIPQPEQIDRYLADTLKALETGAPAPR